MEKSSLARFCEMLSAALNLFGNKAASKQETVNNTPEQTIIRTPPVFIDEKAQIELENMEKNAKLNTGDPV